MLFYNCKTEHVSCVPVQFCLLSCSFFLTLHLFDLLNQSKKIKKKKNSILQHKSRIQGTLTVPAAADLADDLWWRIQRQVCDKISLAHRIRSGWIIMNSLRQLSFWAYRSLQSAATCHDSAGVTFPTKYWCINPGTLTNAPSCANARKTAVASSSCGRGRMGFQLGMERMDRGPLQSTHRLFYGTHENHVAVTLSPLFCSLGIQFTPSSSSNLLIILSPCIPFVFVVPPCLIFIPWLYADSSIVLSEKLPHWLEVGKNETRLFGAVCILAISVRHALTCYLPYCQKYQQASLPGHFPRIWQSRYMTLVTRRLLQMKCTKKENYSRASPVLWVLASPFLETGLDCFNSSLKQYRCPEFQEQASKASR